MSHLSIRLLGPPEVMLDEQPFTAFVTTKARALFYYLAVEGSHPHSRERLAGLLWPDQPEERARQSLRQTLTYLRHPGTSGSAGLEPFLQVTRGYVQFARQSDHWLDVAAFAERIAACRSHRHRRLPACRPCLERLRQAVALYRGDFLAGFFLPDSAAFEEWAMLKREELHQEALEALAVLSDYYERRGEHEQARAYARRQVQLEPWREEAQRQMMRLHALDGQRSAALAQYVTCRRALAEELTMEPSAETQDLYAGIRAQSWQPPPPRHNLPPMATSFIGRAAEVAELLDMLADPDCRLITLVGMGGAGKTRLALQVLAEALGGFADGCYVVSLAGLEGPEEVAPAVADALGFSFYGRGGPEEQLLDYLRSKEVLLLLDSLEHLLPATAFLAKILREAPHVVLLVTSRERLNLKEEWVYEVRGLEEAGAAALFADRARRVQRTFSLQDEQTEVARICRMVEGVPLAVELAAAGAAVSSCAEMAAALAAGLEALSTQLSNVPVRQRSMRATLEQSWKLLTPAEQRALARLSVFRGGFDAQAAERVAGAASDLLSGLARKSLLQEEAAGRLRLHELVRQFAAEHLATDPAEEGAVRDCHSEHYAGRVQIWEDGLAGTASCGALGAMELDLENFHAAWRWALARGRLADIERSLGGLTRFYLRRGPLQEGEALLREAVQAVQELSAEAPVGEAAILLIRLLGEQGRLLQFGARYDQVEAVARGIIAQARRLSPSRAQDAARLRSAEVLGMLLWGQSLLARGQAAAAVPQLDEALRLALEAGLKELEADTRRARGTLAAKRGERAQAKDDFAQALAIYRAVGDRQGESQALNNLGLVAWELGDLAGAQSYMEESLAIKRQLGDRYGEGHAYINLGILHSNRGEYAAALDRLMRARALFHELGDRRGESQTLSNLGVVWRACGEYAPARAHLEESLRLDRQLGERQSESISLANLGLLNHLIGEQDQARDCSVQASELARQSGDRRVEAYALTHLGHALLALGRVAEAEAAYEGALRLRRALGEMHLAMESLAGLARVRLAQGKLAQALAHAEEILNCLDSRSLDGTEEPLRIYWTCYQVLQAAGDGRAKAVRETAHHMLAERAERIGDEAMKTSFLEKVAVHREIRSALAPVARRERP